MSRNLGIQAKDLSIVVNGKNEILSSNKMDFVKLEKASKLKISKKITKAEDLIVIKNGENLEIYYSDGSSVILEDFYTLENISLELPIAENETYLLSSVLEETSETTIIYAQGDVSKFISLLESNETLSNALNEYNHSLSGMNAGDTTATTASATEVGTAGTFAGLSQTAMLVIGGVVVAGTAVAIGSGGGSSSSDSTSSITSSTGYFVDSAVGGVDYYINGVYSGKTSADGSFKYNSGDTITFKIGNITLGTLSANEIPSDGKVMPQDIVGVSRNDVSNSTVVKIAQLLQTLDSDGDASNGITVDATKVTDTTANLEEGTGTALSSMTFNGVTLVTEENAKAHLLETTTTIQASSLGVAADKVVIISIDDTTLKNGETATVTFTFNNAFSATPTESDFSVQGGTLSTLSQVGITKVWTATFTPTTSLEDSTNLITVKADGTLGIDGYKGTSANYTIDTSVPNAPTINTVSTDDLINTTENTNGFNLTGTGEVGATVTVSGFETANKTAVVDGSGNWSISVSDADLADNGSNTLSATQTDVAGNVSSATTKTITTDLIVNAPTINTVSTDDLINATENTNGFNLTGTGEVGATVTVSGFETANKTAVVDGSGNWSISVSDADLADNGSNTLSATQTDVAGNVSSATTKTITTDLVAPVLQSWSADSTTNTITLTYDSPLDSVNLPSTTDFTVTTDGTSNTVSNVSVSGNTITLTMTTDFAQGDAVTVVYTDADGNTANAIQDLAGNDATNINLSSGLVADGYVRGATIYIKPSGDTTGLTLETINGEQLFNTGLTTDEEGNFFLPPNTPAGSIVAIGGINIDTGVPNTMPLKAPEGSTVINPLTTLVQKIVDSGSSTTDAANAVKTAFGIDSSTDITKFDPISENNSTVQKAAATIATVTILAGEENQSTVLDNFTTQILQSSNTNTNLNLSDAGVVGSLLEGTELGFEAQSNILDASSTISSATNISDISQAQSKFLDSIAPSSSTISDTIGNNIHNNTNDTTPTIKVNINTVSVDGTAVVLGDTVYLTIDGVQVQEKVIDATDLENSYVEFTTSSLVEGTYAISAQVEDKSGNISDLYNTYTIVIDTTLPTSPTISKVAVDDIINNTEATNGVTLTGITESGTTVTVNGQNATVNGTTWSYTLTTQSITDMGQGAETLTIVSTDLAGNTSQVTKSITIDTLAPAQTVTVTGIIDNIEPNTGTLASGDTTNDNTLGLTGTISSSLASGEKIAVYNGTTLLGFAIVNGTDWTFATSSLSNNTHDFSAKVVDTAGNEGTLSEVFSVTVDASIPDIITTITNLDVISNQTTQTISGTLSKELTTEVVKVFVDGVVVGEATVNGINWSYEATGLSEGTHNFIAVVENLGGNQGTISTPYNLEIDTTAPTVTIIDNKSSITNGDITYTITFSKDVIDFTAEDIAVTNGTKGSFAQVSDSVYTLVVTPDANFTGNVTVDIAQNIATDSAGNGNTAATTNTQAVDTQASTVVINTISEDNAINKIEKTAGVDISGTAEANGMVVLTLGANNTKTVTVNGSGQWTYTLTEADYKALGEGSKEITAKQTDIAGNVSQTATQTLTISTVAPSLSPVTLDTNSDTGVKGDRISKNNTPTFNFTASNGSTIKYSLDNGSTWTTLESVGTGTLQSITLPEITIDGNTTISFKAVDIVGNESTIRTTTYTLDTQVSQLTNVALGNDTGLSNGDKITKNATLTFDNKETGSKIEYSLDNGETWSTTFSPVQGENNVLVRQIDVAGNISISSEAFSFEYDTVSPTVTVSDVAVDNIINAIEKSETVTITGTNEAGSTVTVNGQNATVNGTIWSYTLTSEAITAMGEGAETLTIVATDVAGNTTILEKAINVDTVSPTVTVSDVAVDNIINAIEKSETVTITGTNEAGSTVTVNGQNAIVNGTTWSYTLTSEAITAMGEGAETLTIVATDIAGNTTILEKAINVDTVSPTVTVSDVAVDNIINAIEKSETVTITGTNEAGSTVTVNGQNATVNGTTWSYTLTSEAITAMGEGAETLTIVATDIAGNTTILEKAINVDTVSPVITITTSDVTKDMTPIISGKAEAGATLTVEVSDATYEVIAAQNGEWSVNLESATPKTGTLTPLQIGQNYTVTVNAIDEAGNNGQTQIQTLHVVENQAPEIAKLNWIDTNEDGQNDTPVMYIGEGQEVNINLQNYVRDEDGDNVTITVNSSSLPAGLSLSDGIITGSTTAGGGSINITLNDGNGGTQTQTILLQTITPPSEDDMTIVNGTTDSSFNAATIFADGNGFFEIDEDNGEMYFGNIKVSGTSGTYDEYQLDGDLIADDTDNFTFNTSNNQVIGGWGTENLSFANAREVTSINGVTTTGLKAVDVTFTMVTPATIQTSTDWWESGYRTWNETTQSSEPITSLNVLRDAMLVTSNFGGDIWINEGFRVKLNGTTGSTSGTLVEMVLDGTYNVWTDENNQERINEHRVPENEVTDGTWSIETIDGIEYLVVEVPTQGTTAFKVENSVLMQTELPASGTTETMTWYYGMTLEQFENMLIDVENINHSPTIEIPTIQPPVINEGSYQIIDITEVLINRSASDIDGDTLGVAITGINSAEATYFYSVDGGATWLNAETILSNLSETNALLLPATTENGTHIKLKFVPNEGINKNTDSDQSSTKTLMLNLKVWDMTVGEAFGYADTTVGTAFSESSRSRVVIEPLADVTDISVVSIIASDVDNSGNTSYNEGDTLTITLNKAVSITSFVASSLSATSISNATLSAVDAIDGYASKFVVTLGSGSSLSSTDTISIVSNSLVDIDGNTNSSEITGLGIIPANTAPELINDPIFLGENLEVNVDLGRLVTDFDNEETTITLKDGQTLPDGLTLVDGVLSGTPTTVQNATPVTFVISDGVNVVEKNIEITIVSKELIDVYGPAVVLGTELQSFDITAQPLFQSYSGDFEMFNFSSTQANVTLYDNFGQVIDPQFTVPLADSNSNGLKEILFSGQREEISLGVAKKVTSINGIDISSKDIYQMDMYYTVIEAATLETAEYEINNGWISFLTNYSNDNGSTYPYSVADAEALKNYMLADEYSYTNVGENKVHINSDNTVTVYESNGTLTYQGWNNSYNTSMNSVSDITGTWNYNNTDNTLIITLSNGAKVQYGMVDGKLSSKEVDPVGTVYTEKVYFGADITSANDFAALLGEIEFFPIMSSEELNLVLANPETTKLNLGNNIEGISIWDLSQKDLTGITSIKFFPTMGTVDAIMSLEQAKLVVNLEDSNYTLSDTALTNLTPEEKIIVEGAVNATDYIGESLNHSPYVSNLNWIDTNEDGQNDTPVMYIGKGQEVNINLQNYVRDEDGDNVTITVNSSSLPAGLSLSDGIITGSTTAGGGSINITLNDGNGGIQIQTILLQTITPPSEDDMTIVNGTTDSSFNAATILSGANGFFEIDEDNGEMYFGNIKVSGTSGTYDEYQLDGDLISDDTDNFTFNTSNNQVIGGWGTESLSFANAREVTSINGVTTTGLKAVDVTFTMVTPATIQTSTDWWESGYRTWNETTQSSEPITSLNVLRDAMLVTSNFGGDIWINEGFRVKLNGTTGSTSGTLVEMVLDGTYNVWTDENNQERINEHRVPENEVTDGTWSIETIDGIEYLVVEVPTQGTTAFKVENSVLMQTELPASGTTETMTWYYGVDLNTFGETVDMISSIDTEIVDGKYEISLLNDISLDLSNLSYSENLLSIDADNGVANSLIITETDVLSMGNLNELYLDLDALDTFDTTGWTEGSTTNIGGISYTSYTSNEATIYLNTTTETVL